MDAGVREIQPSAWDLLMDAGVREVQCPSWELLVEPEVRESDSSLRLQTLVGFPSLSVWTPHQRTEEQHYLGSVDSSFKKRKSTQSLKNLSWSHGRS